MNVLEAGAEPREIVRFAPPLHLSERMESDVKVHRAMAVTYTSLATGKQDNDFPTIRLTSTREVVEHRARPELVLESKAAS